MKPIIDIINQAKVTTYLSANNVAKGGLYSARLYPEMPRLVYMEMRSLEWAYKQSVTFEHIELVANYVYALCGGFNADAETILKNNLDMGTITTPTQTVKPQKIEFTVSSTSLIPIDGNTLTLPIEYKDHNIIFVRNGRTESENNSGATYYTWNPVTLIFTCVGDAVADEEFQIIPVL